MSAGKRTKQRRVVRFGSTRGEVPARVSGETRSLRHAADHVRLQRHRGGRGGGACDLRIKRIHDPVGTHFDPEKLVAQFHAGVPVEQLKRPGAIGVIDS